MSEEITEGAAEKPSEASSVYDRVMELERRNEGKDETYVANLRRLAKLAEQAKTTEHKGG